VASTSGSRKRPIILTSARDAKGNVKSAEQIYRELAEGLKLGNDADRG
jgi:hypothetical protein